MTYVVCQTPNCQQTYPIEQFTPDSKGVTCEKCNGVLIDENGRANLSQNEAVIPVITIEEMKQFREENVASKREQIANLQAEIHELEQDDVSNTSSSL